MGSRNLDATYCTEVVFDRMNVDVVGCFKIDSRILALRLILAPLPESALSLFSSLRAFKRNIENHFRFQEAMLGRSIIPYHFHFSYLSGIIHFLCCQTFDNG